MQAAFYTIMLDEIFIACLFLAIAFTFRWAFRTLPHEGWQIICCFPYRKLPDGNWQGWNLTWYGFFNAVAIVFGVSVLLILMGALSMPLIPLALIFILIIIICLPAARITAFLIEKKPNTYSVGGASFVGILIAPWLIFLVRLAGNKWLGLNISIINILSALSIAYTLGEGVGRLACISFGCCYGKPLKECHPLIRIIFSRHNFIFTGKTKKIAYAHALDGQQIIPVQAMTNLIYSITGLIGFYLFLKGFTATAFLLTLTVTQIWRFLSEFLRADYRGEGEISTYQKMSLLACLYGLLTAYIFYEPVLNKPVLLTGLLTLFNPVLFLFLTALWIITFIYMGKSKVTAALIDIHVNEENI